jgi:hypothetical protein
MPASNTQVSVESTGNLERRMTLRLPADSLETQVGGRLREIARTARIKGFRPGKVPTKVVEQRYGQQVRAEVLDGLLREGFDNAVRDNALRLAGNPEIQPADASAEGDLAYVATFEVMPDFGDIDVEKLQVVRHTAEIGDADIDQMIENLRLQRRSWTAVTRPAKEGDAVDLETWSEIGSERLPAEGSESGMAVIGSGAMIGEIEAAARDGDSLGGIVEVLAYGVPVGLGSHVHWDRKLDSLIAQALMSIQAVKGVEIGDGFEVAGRRGSAAHDPITWSAASGFRRESTLAGGIEGGMSTGELLVARAAMKPLATLNRPTLKTVDTVTKESTVSFKERTDVTAVPAMGVVAETMVALVLATEAQRKFGGDSVGEFVRNAQAFRASLG